MALAGSTVTVTGGTFKVVTRLAGQGGYRRTRRRGRPGGLRPAGQRRRDHRVRTPVPPVHSGPLVGSGTFTGTIGGVKQTLSYSVSSAPGSTIVLIPTPPAAAPEPSQFAALGVGLLGLAGLTLRARKRRTLA